VAPAAQPSELGPLVAGFAERVAAVSLALVVSADGVLVAASDQGDPDQLEKLAAITSGLVALAGSVTQISDGGPFTQALVAMQEGTLVIMAIDHTASLAVLATAEADLEDVAYQMTRLADQAGTLMPAPRTAPPPPAP
jgi:uncharacterized protein